MEIRPNFGGGSPGFIRGGVSFFLQGGSLIFPNRVDFTPLAPPPCPPMGGEQSWAINVGLDSKSNIS